MTAALWANGGAGPFSSDHHTLVDLPEIRGWSPSASARSDSSICGPHRGSLHCFPSLGCRPCSHQGIPCRGRPCRAWPPPIPSLRPRPFLLPRRLVGSNFTPASHRLGTRRLALVVEGGTVTVVGTPAQPRGWKETRSAPCVPSGPRCGILSDEVFVCRPNPPARRRLRLGW